MSEQNNNPSQTPENNFFIPAVLLLVSAIVIVATFYEKEYESLFSAENETAEETVKAHEDTVTAKTRADTENIMTAQVESNGQPVLSTDARRSNGGSGKSSANGSAEKLPATDNDAANNQLAKEAIQSAESSQETEHVLAQAEAVHAANTVNEQDTDNSDTGTITSNEEKADTADNTATPVQNNDKPYIHRPPVPRYIQAPRSFGPPPWAFPNNPYMSQNNAVVPPPAPAYPPIGYRTGHNSRPYFAGPGSAARGATASENRPLFSPPPVPGYQHPRQFRPGDDRVASPRASHNEAMKAYREKMIQRHQSMMKAMKKRQQENDARIKAELRRQAKHLEQMRDIQQRMIQRNEETRMLTIKKMQEMQTRFHQLQQKVEQGSHNADSEKQGVKGNTQP